MKLKVPSTLGKKGKYKQITEFLKGNNYKCMSESMRHIESDSERKIHSLKH